jgi:3-oxoacyl-[acyl-carrier protein] reductase
VERRADVTLGYQAVLSTAALAGRVAVVTGASRYDGIGAAIARHLSLAGAAVVVNDLATPSSGDGVGHRDRDGVARLVSELESMGGTAASFVGDISDESASGELISYCEDRFGSCDILVNNAAAPHGPDRADVTEVPVEAFEAQVVVNLRGPFLLTRAAIPGMRKRAWGRIINIASSAALVGIASRGAYSATKAGIVGLTRSVAADVARDGITVNAVCPGVILTARNRTTIARPGHPGSEHQMWSPMGLPGFPDDIAGAVTYLASDLARYITGQVLAVDGGQTTLREF